MANDISPHAVAHALSNQKLHSIDAWWRAANYLSIGQIYLLDKEHPHGLTDHDFMVVLNELDRFHLATDVIDRVPQLGYTAAYAKQAMRDKLIEHKAYIRQHGEDMPEVSGWRWSHAEPAGAAAKRA